MKNFNLESMRHLTEIENIFIELKKNRASRKTQEQKQIEYKDSTEIELLTLRIKELESEVLRYKKYVKKMSRMEQESEVARIVSEKNAVIEGLKKELTDKNRTIVDLKDKDERVRHEYSGKIEECRKNRSALIKNHMDEITMLKAVHDVAKNELLGEIAVLKQERVAVDDERKALKQTIQDLEKNVEEKKALQKMVSEFKHVENGYRSKILDLQNSIQVYVRLKPKKNAFSGSDEIIDCVKYTMSGNSLISECENRKNVFEFDRILLPDCGQEDVYDEVCSIVYGFLQGYNVCIFAYGQTGSGKTYTMLGDDNSLGLIPRTVNSVYDELSGKDFTLKLRITEIYNERVRDLISNNSSTNNRLETTSVLVHSKEEIMNYIERSTKYRVTEATDCNSSSSRSHSIYSLQLKVKGKREIIESTLNFVDLAGSERIKESHVEGRRLKETQNINKSLLNLKIVFNSIINKDKHVPYRDSKLTYFLKGSLENKSKVLMLLNISIDEKDYNETLCSLRFGQVVSTVCTGRGAKQLVKEIE